MKSLRHARRGQFLVIAAFLVLIVITSSMIAVFNTVREAPFTETVAIANIIAEINTSVKRILSFTVGYYGSILQVTGNQTYAQEKATSYIYSGITNIAHSHLEWNPTIEMTNLALSTNWFTPVSWSAGNITISYSLPNLGLEGVHYTTTCFLQVEMVDTIDSHSIVNVKKENGQPNLYLTKKNFFFYSYDYDTYTWNLLPLETEPTVSIDGNYALQIPPTVSTDVYFLKVVDTRGITASAFYSPTGKNEYAYDFEWNSSLYQSLQRDTLVVEVLQNGSFRWLGESLPINGGARPLPPVPVRSIRVNQTINGIDEQVPFQLEEWGSDYTVPLGFSNNASILGSRSLLVFLANHNVSRVTIWWDGQDVALQSSFARENRYFLNDDPDSHILTNDIITLDLSDRQEITAIYNDVSSTAEFLRINGRSPVYGSALSYTIHHGIVRDVIQQEAEWSGGIADCPDIYSHIVVTLPANANYYTFSTRTLFLSSDKNRDIVDLSALQLQADRGQALTEDGVLADKPIVTGSPPTVFYNGGTQWAHHWSEYVDANSKGAGMMYRNGTNADLYAFDSIAGGSTGALELLTSSRTIEFNPIARFPVNDFQVAYDIAWHGAVVTMGSGAQNETVFPYESSYDVDTVYPGLWVIVEHPPTINRLS